MLYPLWAGTCCECVGIVTVQISEAARSLYSTGQKTHCRAQFGSEEACVIQAAESDFRGVSHMKSWGSCEKVWAGTELGGHEPHPATLAAALQKGGGEYLVTTDGNTGPASQRL